MSFFGNNFSGVFIGLKYNKVQKKPCYIKAFLPSIGGKGED